MECGPEPAVLAASVASEFNDELTLLLNELVLTMEMLGREHPARARMKSAHHAILRCTAITGSLLEFTRRTGAPGRTRPLGSLLAGPR